MISTIKDKRVKQQATIYKKQVSSLKRQTESKREETQNKFSIKTSFLSLVSCSLLLVPCLLVLSSCGVYTFKDVSIPDSVKTIKISYIENKARIVNPQLSPRLTEALQQKIANQTRLTRTTNDDAHYQISGAITNYSVSYVGVTGKQASQNQLTVGVHIVFRNTLQNKTDEFDVSRDFPFAASQTLDQAVNTLMPDILKNITDEIFNHIFSNW
jgi:hypothetical protein